MRRIPGRRPTRFYEKRHVVEGISVVPPLVAAVGGAAANLANPATFPLGWALLGGAAWLSVASVVKVLHAGAQDRERRRTEDYEGLRGALFVLHGVIRRALDIPAEPDGILRVTTHRVVPAEHPGRAPEELEQLVPYVGGGGGGAGRRFSVRSGIIGRAVREKAIYASSREYAGYENYVAELIHSYSFTKADARALSADRQAWMAVPLLSRDEEAVAVVYLDSCQLEFFDPRVQQIVLGACAGIAAFTEEAY
ncbi:MAG TPA: hypothetical protein VF665_10025 [Longimicrobium sp.]|jgi:hypothetical protein|uniref:hypothetical protein n=1 Tax=Longimicrobium sp. TaxID=2029185 RepID=UPI002ED985BE